MPWAIGLLTNRWVVLALAAAGVYLVGQMHGRGAVYEAWREANEAAAQKAVPVIVRQGAITVKTVTVYRDRIVKVKGATVTLIKEIPVYVPPAADVVLPHGWVRLHDAAATGAVPEAPAGTDVAAPAVAASEAVKGVIENYGTCRENSLQLLALQEWVRYQYQNANGEMLGY